MKQPADAIECFRRRLEFGQRIRNRRSHLNLTQVEVAASAGWTSPVLLAAETGKAISPDVRAWIAIANKLQLNPTEVIEWVWRARGTLELSYVHSREVRKRVIATAIEEHGVIDEVAAALR